VQLCVYDHAIVLTRRNHRTHTWTSYAVSEQALRAALVDDRRSSGYLPPWTVAVGQIDDAPWLLVAVPPRAVSLVRDGSADAPYTFVTPPLLLGGWKRSYVLFALPGAIYPAPDTALFRAPFPNCSSDGRICWGSATPPAAEPRAMLPALALFLEGTLFSSHLADGKSRRFPTDVCAHYRTLLADAPYPIDDLVACERTLGSLLTGTPWRG